MLSTVSIVIIIAIVVDSCTVYPRSLRSHGHVETDQSKRMHIHSHPLRQTSDQTPSQQLQPVAQLSTVYVVCAHDLHTCELVVVEDEQLQAEKLPKLRRNAPCVVS